MIGPIAPTPTTQAAASDAAARPPIQPSPAVAAVQPATKADIAQPVTPVEQSSPSEKAKPQAPDQAATDSQSLNTTPHGITLFNDPASGLDITVFRDARTGAVLDQLPPERLREYFVRLKQSEQTQAVEQQVGGSTPGHSAKV